MFKKMFAIVLTGILLCGTFSCNKIKDALFPAINIDLPSFQFTVPAIPFVLGSEASLGSFSMRFNFDSLIKAQTGGVFGAGAVSTVKVKQIEISLNNADQSNNLANFESARFTLSSNTKTTPVEIASFVFPDKYATFTTASVADGPELKEYIAGTELIYTLYGKARRVTTKALNFNVLVTVTAK